MVPGRSGTFQSFCRLPDEVSVLVVMTARNECEGFVVANVCLVFVFHVFVCFFAQ